jgi:hypothetical protein
MKALHVIRVPTSDGVIQRRTESDGDGGSDGDGDGCSDGDGDSDGDGRCDIILSGQTREARTSKDVEVKI